MFDFVADERNEPRYTPRMVSARQLSTRPIRPGTRIRAEAKMRPRRVPMMIEFTEWQWELKPHGAPRLTGPVFGRIGERQEREIWIGLTRLLEDEAA